ncbi:MAG: proteasome accessory factor [Frankiaceae bacterium]|nr:proteasome accessory factor [Frankiaceae bacterium]
MQARKTERLLNLVIALLATRRGLNIGQIRDKVQGYEDQTDEAFERMFERDKAELRDLGVPLETVLLDAWSDEQAYKIARGDYELPDVVLAADEAAAVGLAVRFWRSDEMSAAVASALRKLRAAGVEVDEPLPTGLEPVVDASDPGLLTLWDAVRDKTAVRFPYRAASGSATTERHLEPWGVASWHGRWYVGGHDRDRGEPRVFRLDRISGPIRADKGGFEAAVPASVDVAGMVAAAEPDPSGHARVRVRAGAGHDLRRSSAVVSTDEGWDELDYEYGDIERAAQWVAGLGADAVVLDPPELRAAVIRRLRGVLDGVA